MIIVVDTNKVFSAILNSNGKIGRILLYPPSHLRFYSTTQLLSEIDQNSEKIKKFDILYR
jgi:predicted nucleic acid-binding protein